MRGILNMVSQKRADSPPETISEGEHHCKRNAQLVTIGHQASPSKSSGPWHLFLGPCMPYTPPSSVFLIVWLVWFKVKSKVI